MLARVGLSSFAGDERPIRSTCRPLAGRSPEGRGSGPAITLTAPPRTVIVSSAHVLGRGGLSVYARRVAEWLAVEHGSTVTIARFARDDIALRAYAYREPARVVHAGSGVEIRIVAPRWSSVPALHLVSRTIDRRYLDRFTLGVVGLAFRRALDRAIPRDTEVVHLVGSAWELLGFAAREVARTRGIGFSMWPAIHPGQWGDGPLDVRLLTAADLVFAQSAHEASTMRALGVRTDQIRVAPLGPAVSPAGDGDRFRASHGLGTSPLVVFIGRKERYKGYDDTVAAWTIVQRAMPDARLVTIGSGTSTAGADGVLDLGGADEETKADALAACDVFCMPSSGEAFGMVYVEAWSYGKPVIVGPAPAARELVEDGRTGLHADQDPASIARALVTLLSDPPLARWIGQEGRAVQHDRYTWGAVWRVHTEAFIAARQRAASVQNMRHPRAGRLRRAGRPDGARRGRSS